MNKISKPFLYKLDDIFICPDNKKGWPRYPLCIHAKRVIKQKIEQAYKKGYEDGYGQL